MWLGWRKELDSQYMREFRTTHLQAVDFPGEWNRPPARGSVAEIPA